VRKIDNYDVNVVGGRIVAQLIDGLLLLIIASGLILLGGGFASEVQSLSLLVILSLFLSPLVYNAGMEAYWDGQTVGKKVMNIKVLSVTGTEAGLGKSIVRNLPAVFSLGLFSILAALLCMALSDRKQRLFDHLAGTVVVRDGTGNIGSPGF